VHRQWPVGTGEAAATPPWHAAARAAVIHASVLRWDLMDVRKLRVRIRQLTGAHSGALNASAKRMQRSLDSSMASVSRIRRSQVALARSQACLAHLARTRAGASSLMVKRPA